MKQKEFFKKGEKAFGGELMKSAKGRLGCRPISTKSTMHLILRSSKAKGDWSFKKIQNENKIKVVIQKFSRKYGVKILSLANVGNHLHFQIKLSNRRVYPSFIRAIAGSIAMAVTGSAKGKPFKKCAKDRFWDYRPFTRIVAGLRDFLGLRDYIQLNQLEGFGVRKQEGRFLLKMQRLKYFKST
jgi:REP element-mobilizing transposase RayT